MVTTPGGGFQLTVITPGGVKTPLRLNVGPADKISVVDITPSDCGHFEGSEGSLLPCQGVLDDQANAVNRQSFNESPFMKHYIVGDEYSPFGVPSLESQDESEPISKCF
jgi:hypothetical protein